MLVNERSRLRTFVSSARVRADQAQHTVLSSTAEGQLNYSQPIRGSKGTKKKKKRKQDERRNVLQTMSTVCMETKGDLEIAIKSRTLVFRRQDVVYTHCLSGLFLLYLSPGLEPSPPVTYQSPPF